MTIALLIIFVLIQILDVWTTAYGLKHGAEEAMPLANTMFARLGFWPTVLILKGVIVSVAVAATFLTSNGYWFTGPLCLFGLYVLWNNYKVISE